MCKTNLSSIVNALTGRIPFEDLKVNGNGVFGLLNDLRGCLLNGGQVALVARQFERFRDELCTRESPYQSRFRVLANECIASLEYLHDEPPAYHGAWSNGPIPRRSMQIPGMMNMATRRYLRWLGTQLEGTGAIVDLGCWMGAASCAVLEGLMSNPNIADQRVHAIDAFQWMPWMGRQTVTGPKVQNLAKGDSFLPVLLQSCAVWSDRLVIQQSALPALKAKAAGVSETTWNGEKIELLLVDVSGERATWQAVWDTFSTALVPRRSIVVVQQYGLLRSHAIRRFFRGLKATGSLHSPVGPLQSFLYVG